MSARKQASEWRTKCTGLWELIEEPTWWVIEVFKTDG